MPGRGSPEVALVLVYDIEDDTLRNRVSEMCLDYGLERIQFSAFFGRLNRNRRQELALRLAREVNEGSARIRIYPICDQDLKEMWSLDQYRQEKGETADRPRRPGLKILSGEQ
jgi:CRISPR-associated protein Cas2